MFCWSASLECAHPSASQRLADEEETITRSIREICEIYSGSSTTIGVIASHPPPPRGGERYTRVAVICLHGMNRRGHPPVTNSRRASCQPSGKTAKYSPRGIPSLKWKCRTDIRREINYPGLDVRVGIEIKIYSADLAE